MTESTWPFSISRLHCRRTMTTHGDGSAPLDRNSQCHCKKTCIWHCTLAQVTTVLYCTLKLRAAVTAEMMQNKPMWSFHLLITAAPYTGAKRCHRPWPSCFQDTHKSYFISGSGLLTVFEICQKLLLKSCAQYMWWSIGRAGNLHTGSPCCKGNSSCRQAVALDDWWFSQHQDMMTTTVLETEDLLWWVKSEFTMDYWTRLELWLDHSIKQQGWGRGEQKEKKKKS